MTVTDEEKGLIQFNRILYRQYTVNTNCQTTLVKRLVLYIIIMSILQNNKL
jgi:hypothetical protein